MKTTSRRQRPPTLARPAHDRPACACQLPLKLMSAAVLAACAGTAWALPQGGQLVAGQGNVASSGGTMTVTQQSQNLILNWQGFSIGSGETVRFNQPSSSAVALNRVIGSDPSSIYGNLQANGQVFLINPNGILFGAGARVDVGGLVASTLDIGNADFNNGRYRFTASNARPAGIVNQGTLAASPGGYIALIGGQVSNQGVISARLGTAALIAGQAATLDFTGTRLMQVRVDGAALGALAENRQLINADGGTVLMTAYARDALLDTVVNNSGIIEARTLEGQSGTIKLLGDFSGGTVKVGGTLDASAPAALNPNGGNGGYIDTSGAHVKVDDGLRISTRAENGATGNWLIDPADYNIAATGGDISGATLSAALAASNVTIQSSSGATSSGSGDINVRDNVSWSANTLTLTAARDINVSAVMSATGSAALTINTNTANGGDAAAGSGYLNMMLTPSGFTGRIDYSASGALTINGETYVVVRDINTLQTMTRNISFALGSDIDASSVADFTPLDLGPFSAHTQVQGLGHVVRNYNSSQGGLVGQTGGSVQNIGLTGNISGGTSMATGALAGQIYGFGIRNSFSTANVTATGSGYYVGGLAGSATQIVNSWSTGNVTGQETAGGLVGSGGTIINSWSSANVSSDGTFLNGPVGGLAGYASRVVNSFATGSVSSIGGNAGGLVGYFHIGEMIDSFATGNVSSGTNYAGGLVGGAQSGGNITRSYATGTVSGNYAGGLAGMLNAATITDSYATGAVSSNLYAGGLVGAMYDSALINRSYAAGAVTGPVAGGLVGLNYSNTTPPAIQDSFWNTETTGQSQSWGRFNDGNGVPGTETNVVGATSAELGQSSRGAFFTANAGSWDFANTWYAGVGTGAGPILRTSPFTVKVTVASASGTAGSALPTPVVTYSGNLWAGDSTARFSATPLTSANGSTAGVYDWGATASGTSVTGQQYRFIYDPVTPAPTLTLAEAPVPPASQNSLNTSPGYTGALNYVGGSGGAGGGTVGGLGDAAGEAANGGAQKGKGAGAQGEGGAPLIGVQGPGMRLPPGVPE